ncbi:MAG TPA: biosynthetic peptidoglycan transglycosylase [Trebonia sp.]|nr:biosynthetic peptidoglycan transglycosylase [Trebonia sp.]
MRNTRSLPPEPDELDEPSRFASARRAFRYARRAVIAVVTVAGVLAIAAGVLWLATPSASEATGLAAQQARAHHIAYPGPGVPANFARALVATEDHRFYTEPGVDLIAVGRVVWGKITGGGDQGGATIEQQLAKMLYTPGKAGFGAELTQVVLAVKLNLAYPKQQLLDLYAETAYYGHGYSGLEAASCGYFGHPAADLTVVQGAMLAGVVNAPSADDPVSDPANARARLEHVIARMEAVGYLTKAQARQALAAPLGLTASRGPGC